MDIRLPLQLLHPDLFELGRTFVTGEDQAIMQAFILFEDRLRQKSKLEEHGAKLVNRAYSEKDGPLTWFSCQTRDFDKILKYEIDPFGSENNLFAQVDKRREISTADLVARRDYMKSIYGMYRNARAHTDFYVSTTSLVSEFLAVNKIYKLMMLSELREQDSVK